MINKKISTIAGSLIILAIVTVLGFSFLDSNKKEEMQNQNNVILNNSDLENKKEEVNTSNWKVCRNEKNGYEFKYPDTWRLGAPVNRDINDCNDQIEKESLVMWSNIPGETEKATFSINSNASSREDFVSQNKAEINIEKELEIGGNPVLIYTKNGPRGEIKFMVIFKDGASYGITASELSSNATFDALVANFKLLNNTEKPVDVSSWKTCKNEKANYEFKYPNDWLIVNRYLTILDSCDNSSSPRSSGFSIGLNRYNSSNKSFGINTSTQKDLEETIYKGVTSLDEYYSRNDKLLSSRTKIKETTLLNERVDWFKEQSDNKVSIWFFHNNTLYEIRSDIEDQKLIEIILNTFRFPNN